MRRVRRDPVQGSCAPLGINSSGSGVSYKRSAAIRLLGVDLPGPLGDALRQCRRHFVAAASFSLLINILYLAPTLYMLQVYDRVVPTGGKTTLLFVTLALALSLVAMCGLDMVRLGSSSARANASMQSLRLASSSRRWRPIPPERRRRCGTSTRSAQPSELRSSLRCSMPPGPRLSPRRVPAPLLDRDYGDRFGRHPRIARLDEPESDEIADGHRHHGNRRGA